MVQGFEPSVPQARHLLKKHTCLLRVAVSAPFGNPFRIRRLIWVRLFEPGSTARWRFHESLVRLSRVPAPLRSVSHKVCRRAPGSVPRGYGAVPPYRHGSGDRRDMLRIIPVGFCRWTRAKTRSPRPRLRALGSPPANLLVAAFGGRPRPRVAVCAFASAAEADLGLLAGGVLLTRFSTRSAVSRSIN